MTPATLRIALLALSVQAALLAQVQLFQFDGTNETAVGQSYDVGTWAVGDDIVTRFRLFNQGQGPATLQSISLSGAAFALSGQPSSNYIIAPGQFAEFKVTFSPPAAALGYSATLLLSVPASPISVVLRGSAVAASALYLNGSLVSAGSTVDFGTAQTGVAVTRNLTLLNPSAAALTVSSISVTGTDFTGPSGISTPLTLAAGQSVPFAIAFKPSAPNPSTGILAIDGRSFNLTGLGVNPPLPKAALQISSSAGVSDAQETISVRLASPSPVPGSGTLAMDFQPTTPGMPDDSMIGFLSGPHRVTTVTIAAGDTVGKFGGNADFTFNTGTTAGTITFTLTLPNDTEQATVVIPPAAITLDTATGTKLEGTINVGLIGFDNTHSASQLTFTFYDTSGNVLKPGPIIADETSAFSTYFAAGLAGGMFQLLAQFPVTGDATQIAGVDIAVRNSVGSTRTQRITF